MSAILLPHRSSTEVDWPAFEAHVARTAEAGLTPAVNMDTGYVHLLSPEARAEVLGRTRSLGVEFVAGAFDAADVEAVQALGGTPVLFPSAATVDVVISNCVVNLSVDKPAVFAETFRVLKPGGRIGITDVVAEDRLSPEDRAERGAWVGCIAGALSKREYEAQLAAAGVHSRLEHPPAMCFLDITGYTRLTQERGDAAAAELAEQIGGIVQRISVKHGGRPVKWLGDGVMLHFPNPGPGVVAALEMGTGMSEAGLPPAHVGIHAGPVIFQEGDYYGQTVNVAARIAEYARPDEVIVSQAVVDASDGVDVTFKDIGPVELKGVSGALHLHVASQPG